jgi:myo-inositol 2-dehydrogenase/D-chiro-inositol 1-dehydrogenase
MTIKVALLGAGRMGCVHAAHLAAMPGVEVALVADPDPEAARRAGQLARSQRVSADPLAALDEPGLDAALIATPTPTHAAYVRRAAGRGLAVFCEKPVALDLGETLQVHELLRRSALPFQIGFQRRFDPGYREAKRRLEAGQLGQLEQFRSVGRDPEPPPLAYLRGSGGIFLDQAVHEFDLARYLVGEVEQLQAFGAVRVDPRIAELGDVDTAITVLRFRDGTLGVIENSRRAVYGYDVRTELFGSLGKLVVEALPKTPLLAFGEGGVVQDHYWFFVDRFKEAARLELEAFFLALQQGRPPSPDVEDALQALRLALAARRSQQEVRPVSLSEIPGAP